MKGLFSIQYSVFNYVWVLACVFQGPVKREYVCVCVCVCQLRCWQTGANASQLVSDFTGLRLGYISVISLSLSARVALELGEFLICLSFLPTCQLVSPPTPHSLTLSHSHTLSVTPTHTHSHFTCF